MAISVKSLSVSRGGINLLQDVDIELKNGQAGILRGPNGVGKTTLLRALAGLQPFDSGEIECSLEDICYSGHADGIKPTLTVQENLEFWANIFGSPSISEVAEKFMIIDFFSNAKHNQQGLMQKVAQRNFWMIEFLDSANLLFLSPNSSR